MAAANPPLQPEDLPDSIGLAVLGAHLADQPLNHQLTDLGARFVASVRTAPTYRFYALATVPPKPGLVRVDDEDDGAASIEAEVWALTPSSFAVFVDSITPPLVIGRVMLEDGTDVAGFLCEPFAVHGAVDITSFGGWRAYLASF